MQKYVHDLAAWDALPVEEQERAIGRTKLSDIELPDERQARQLARRAEHDRRRRRRPAQIVRFNMPFGRVGAGEFGTYFIGYARSPDVIEQMLTNMFIGKPPGNYDRILDFSTAVTGTCSSCPTVDFLDDPPAPGGALGRAADASHDTEQPGRGRTRRCSTMARWGSAA